MSYKKNLSNKKYLLIILIAVFLSASAIGLIIFLTINKGIKNERQYDEPEFSINTTVHKLSQYLMMSYQVHNSVTTSINSSNSMLTLTKYDIYTINESLSENKKNFSKKILQLQLLLIVNAMNLGKIKLIAKWKTI